LNFEEAAAYLDLSKSYLYKLTSSSQIPHFKPSGKKVYFDIADLDQWLRRKRIRSIDEIENEASDRLLGERTGRRKAHSSNKVV
jgi:excisionase family DNA binding protein